MVVERVLGVEAVPRSLGAAEHCLGVVEVYLAGEHVLASGLVPARADEALLVAVVGHGVAAGREHQRLRELDACQVLGLALPVARQEHRGPAHVVVPEEGRQLVGVAVGVGVPVVLGEEVAQHVGRVALGEVDALLLEPEVERGLELAGRRVLRHHRGVAVVDLAEGEEVVVADAVGRAEDVRHELLPELEVDVLHGVDPEAVDAELDPALVDLTHAVDDLGPLGEQVVQADEVAVRRGLTGEGRVAPVVVHRRVVEPGRGLGVLVPLGEERGVREGSGVELGPLGGRLAHVVAVVERLACGILVRVGLLGAVGVLLLLVVDDVRGVVGDDVEEDLHPLGVRGVDEVLHVLVGPEVRVDLGEVGDPVPVVAGALLAGAALNRLVLEAGGEPDRGGAHALDVVQLLGDALEVTTVVEALVGGVVAGLQRPTREPTAVVRGRAVGKPVSHDEVEPLTSQRRAQRVLGQLGVSGGGSLVEVGGREGDHVRGVVEGEGDRRRAGEQQRDVVAVEGASRAVVLGPGAVEGDLEGEVALGNLEGALEDLGVTDAGQLALGAGRVPVTRAADLALQVTHQGDGCRGRLCGYGRQERWGERDRATDQDGGQASGCGHRCSSSGPRDGMGARTALIRAGR